MCALHPRKIFSSLIRRFAFGIAKWLAVPAEKRKHSPPKRTLKTVDRNFSLFGWHFYALLNSSAKFASVPSAEIDADRVTEQMCRLNEVRTNKIQRRFGKSRK